jgi:hypothetical protein
MQFDKADIIIASAFFFFMGMIFGLWITSGQSTQPTQVNYFQKYGIEVCRQRNAVFHKFEGLNYYVCMDKDTKVLSDFD